jgi:hypothetical protein
MAAPFPADDQPEPEPAAVPVDQGEDPVDQGEDPADQGDDPADDTGAAGGRSPGWTRSVLAPPGGGDAAGFVLGLLVWGWIVLPFLRDGTTGVKDVWRAKWLNKAVDGSELP